MFVKLYIDYSRDVIQKEVCIPFIITKKVNLIHFADTFTKVPKTAHWDVLVLVVAILVVVIMIMTTTVIVTKFCNIRGSYISGYEASCPVGLDTRYFDR